MIAERLPVICARHASPIGELTLVATDAGLCGLYFEGHKGAPDGDEWQPGENAHLEAAREWLDRYFAGKGPGRLPRLAFMKGTSFQHRVWYALRQIPRGETRTYSNISHEIGSPRSVRAVGAAIGRNPISIFIPCHRVVGRDGTLTGFAGGMARKAWLLEHEAAARRRRR